VGCLGLALWPNPLSLAEEIWAGIKGRTWVSPFVKRHKNVLLKNAYLRNLDNVRLTAENEAIFMPFLTLVL
jgi:hypothetical protein